MQSNPAKLNPRCWNCDKPMSSTLREITVFCSPECEWEYHSTQRGQSAIYTVLGIACLAVIVGLMLLPLTSAVISQFSQLFGR